MAFKVGELFAELGLDDGKFNQGLGKAEGKFGGLVGTAAKAGVALTAAVVTGVGALAAKGVAEFASFDKGMREVFTLMPGVSDAAMGEMSDDVLQLAKDIGVLPEEIIPSLYNSLSAGIPAGNVFDFLADADQLAVAGVAELDEAVDLLSGTVNAYGGDLEVAARASDVWFATVQAGKTTLPELNAALGKVLPTAATFGVSIEDVGAAMATLTKITGNTAESSTALNALLGELGKSGTTASKAFEKAAGQSFPEFIKAGGNINDVIQIMQGAADDAGLSILDMFSSLEAGKAAASLATGDLLVENLDAITDSAGAVGEAYETMDGGVSRSMDKIKANIGVAFIQIGEVVAPIVEKMLDWLVDRLPAAIDATVGAFQAAATVIEPALLLVGTVMEKIGGIVSAVFGAFRSDTSETAGHVSATLTGLSATIGTILGQIGELFTAATSLVSAVWDLFGDELLSIIGPVMDGIMQIVSGALSVITGIIQAFTALITGDWETFGDAVAKIWDGLWSIVSGIVGAATSLISAIISAFIDLLMAIFGGMATSAIALFESLWSTVTGIFTGMASAVTGIITGMAGMVTSLVSGLVNTVTSMLSALAAAGTAIIQGLATSILTIWQNILNFFSGVRASILGFFAGAGSWLLDVGRQIVQGLIDGITAMWGNVKSKFTGLTNLIPDWKGPESTDRVLLKPAGQMIMAGLLEGIDGKSAELRRMLSGITDDLSSAFTPNVSVAGITGAITAPGGTNGFAPVPAGPVSNTVTITVTGGNVEETKRGVLLALIDAGIAEEVGQDLAGVT